MGKKIITGICHICGADGLLTFEHVPPQAAFNNTKVRKPKFEQFIDKGPDYYPEHAPIQQKGAGGFTLCGNCNNLTGKWYAKDYIQWAYQAANMLVSLREANIGNSNIQFPFYIFPLRVIKQIITMFFSINNPGFARKNYELVKFVLNRDEKYLNPKYKIYSYYCMSNSSRQNGFSFMSNSNGITTLSELSFFPFGFVMTIDSPPPDNRLVDITYFARFGYNDFDIHYLNFPLLPTHMALPGDYRTKKEIYDDYDKNIGYE